MFLFFGFVVPDAFERAQQRVLQPNVVFCPPEEIYYNKQGALVFDSRKDLIVQQETLNDYFVGAQLAGRWVIERFIQAGSYGRGWAARDQHTNQRVFIKTFRCWRDREHIPSDKKAYKHALRAHERGIRQEIKVRQSVSQVEIDHHVYTCSETFLLFLLLLPSLFG